MSTKRRAPGLRRKRAVWYFDNRSQPTMKKVERMISGPIKRIFESQKKKPVVTIAACNRDKIITRSLDEGLADVIMLNPLDFYKIFRWINRKTLDFSRFRGQKIVFYNFPIISYIGSSLDNRGKFYLCLEGNTSIENDWIFTVRAEEYLRAQGYRIACLLK